MKRQLEISFEDIKSPEVVAFEKFDKANPRCWQLFAHFTHEAIEANAIHFGAQAILERIRWETAINTQGEFKVNNNYAPFYARKFHEEFPEHKGFFRTRESVADKQT